LPKAGQRYVYDDGSLGLAVRISPRGTKTFVWYGKFNGTPLRITLGRSPATSVDQARSDAAAIRADIAAGYHPLKAQVVRDFARWRREKWIKKLVDIADRLRARQFQSLGEFKDQLRHMLDDLDELPNRVWLWGVAAAYLELVANALPSPKDLTDESLREFELAEDWVTGLALSAEQEAELKGTSK